MASAARPCPQRATAEASAVAPSGLNLPPSTRLPGVGRPMGERGSDWDDLGPPWREVSFWQAVLPGCRCCTSPSWDRAADGLPWASLLPPALPDPTEPRVGSEDHPL